MSVDASENIAVACVHTRCLKTDGTFHVQLLAAKSKLVTRSTIPRAELKSMMMGAVLSHVCRRNMIDQVKNIIYVSDSAIALFWINQDQRPLQIAIRNSVIEIRRFSSPDSWFHVQSEDNIADIGTRATVVEQLGSESEWQSGKQWMAKRREEMPLQSCDELTLSTEEKKKAADELKAADLCGVVLPNLKSKVADRYKFTKYVVDPLVLPWPKPVHILVLVQRFISKLRSAVQNKSKPLKMKTRQDVLKEPIVYNEKEISGALMYFYKLATLEVKQFTKPNLWVHSSVMKDEVLYSTSRILDGQEILDVPD